MRERLDHKEIAKPLFALVLGAVLLLSALAAGTAAYHPANRDSQNPLIADDGSKTDPDFG